jgi:DNA polymerase III gamma/tau subunit
VRLVHCHKAPVEAPTQHANPHSKHSTKQPSQFDPANQPLSEHSTNPIRILHSRHHVGTNTNSTFESVPTKLNQEKKKKKKKIKKKTEQQRDEVHVQLSGNLLAPVSVVGYELWCAVGVFQLSWGSNVIQTREVQCMC